MEQEEPSSSVIEGSEELKKSPARLSKPGDSVKIVNTFGEILSFDLSKSDEADKKVVITVSVGRKKDQLYIQEIELGLMTSGFNIISPKDVTTGENITYINYTYTSGETSEGWIKKVHAILDIPSRGDIRLNVQKIYKTSKRGKTTVSIEITRLN